MTVWVTTVLIISVATMKDYLPLAKAPLTYSQELGHSTTFLDLCLVDSKALLQ